MTKQKKLNAITVDGIDYLWHIERNPQWCTTDGWKGPMLHIKPAAHSGRCLNVELPFELRDHKSTPYRQRPKISESVVSQSIRDALSAGWNPSSRGRVFRYIVNRIGDVR